MQPLVSIIIRARDEETSLRRLIPLLQAQEADFAFEIWLLDNDSCDGSARLAQAAGLRYHHIPRSAFNYATALNTGISLAQGEYVVSLSAHCFPQHNRWLTELIRPLQNDPSVIGTYGRQWTNPQIAPFEAIGNDIMFPEAGRTPAIVAFSNANSAVRKSYLLTHPYNPVIKILEDHLLFLELPAPLRITYVPEAFVHHEHEAFRWRYYVKRWLREGWAAYYLVDYRGLTTPFAHRAWLHLPSLLRDYPYSAAVFLKRGRFREALLTIPFFILRDLTWMVGRISAWNKRTMIATEDHRFRHDHMLFDQLHKE